MKLFHYHSMAILTIWTGLTACVASPSIPQFYQKSWTNYAVCDNRCSISIPPILEEHTKQDKYTQVLGVWDPEVTIFQQKGLAEAEIARYDDHYCRVLLKSFTGNDNDYPAPKEQFPIDNEWRAILRQYVDSALEGYPLIVPPTYRWIDIDNNGNKAIEISYQRRGNNWNTTNVTIYMLFNSDIMVEMIVAYRESEKELWLPAVKNIIYTFKWADNKKHIYKPLIIKSYGFRNYYTTNCLGNHVRTLRVSRQKPKDRLWMDIRIMPMLVAHYRSNYSPMYKEKRHRFYGSKQ